MGKVSWDAAGELDSRLSSVDKRLASRGQDPGLGTCTEEEWQQELRHATGMSPEQLAAFLRAYWDVYCGTPNEEMLSFLRGLRPRYRTALLSNSGVGARREEQERYHYSELTDLIVYSHEEGIAKPDLRIYAVTCERLGTQPEEVVYLDDVELFVAAVKAVGMHVILFINTTQAIAYVQSSIQEQAI